MAGNAKPNIENLRVEGKITFLKTDTVSYFDSMDSLIDGDLKSKSGYGFLFHPNNYLIFEINQKSNIYAYGQSFSDGGGSAGKNINLYKKVNEEYKSIKKNIPTKQNEWYLLFEELDKGIYKIEGTAKYTVFTEWYVESLYIPKYLLNKDNELHSIKDTVLYSLYELNLTEEIFQKYGFDDEELLNLSKFNGQVEMKYEGECCDGELFSYKIENWVKNVKLE